MRTAFSAIMLGLVFVGAGPAAAGSDIAVVRGTFTEKLDPQREGPGIKIYLGNVTACLDEMAVPYDLLTDEDVEAGKLGAYKLAILPYHPQRTKKWVDAVVQYVRQGGKIFIFYSVDERIAELLGIKVESHFRRKEKGDLALIKFKPGIVKGVPDSTRQTSWSTRVVAPIGEGRVLATWCSAAGKDTGYPALVLSPNGVYMAHVLLGDDISGKAQFMFACLAHFLPNLWTDSASRCAGRIGRFATFDSIDSLKKRLETEAKSRKIPERAAQLLKTAEAQKKRALSLAEQKKYTAAVAAAAEADQAARDVYSYLVAPRRGECRGVWIPPTPWTTWDEVMKNLQDNGFNAAFPAMCDGYSANYASDVLPPSPMMKESGDQLAQCMAAARKHGIQVHVWRVNWRASRLTDEQRKALESGKRLQIGANGEKDDGHGGKWLCPSKPANRKLEIDAMLEIVRKYKPDGIHFDYIRYPNANFCCCPGCRERFEQSVGAKIAEWPKDVRSGGKHFEAFDNWRRDQITQTVAAVSEQARKLDPYIRISAAVFRNWAVHRESVGQDWKVWCEKGYLDFVCPMDYTDDPQRLEKEVDEQVEWVAGAVPLYPGIGAFSSASRFPDASHLLHQMEIARNRGADGFVIFHYNEDLAKRFLPVLHRSATSVGTFLPHDAPRIRFEFPKPLIPNRPRSYATDLGAKIEMSFAENVMGRVEYERADGQVIKSLDAILAEDKRERSVRIHVAEGPSRIAVYGETPWRDGKPVQYVSRSAPIIGLSDDEVEDHELRSGPPTVPPGEGMRVGVVADGFGSTAVLKALKLRKDMRPFAVHNFTPDSLAVCDVLVLPQMRDPARLTPPVRESLRDFVLKGGGLVVTHDAVGYRNHAAIVPEIATKGTAHPKGVQCKSAVDHPVTKGLPVGEVFGHTYSDHVAIQPGPKGTAVIADADGQAVVVVGRLGAGRYVANGMASGLGPDNADAPLKGREQQLFTNMVQWAGGK